MESEGSPASASVATVPRAAGMAEQRATPSVPLGPPSSDGARSAPSGPTSGFPRIEKYELLEEIGHGGMATVYRARDPRLGREVAVKVIHKHLRENPEVGTRFVAEARAAAKLRHPGIVDVFDVSGDDDPERYLIVELIRGTTLRKVLQKHRDMPAEIGASIVLRLCDALQHAHTAAIIHRDIKPENVLVELPADRAAASGHERDPHAATPTPPPVEATPLPVASASDTQLSLADAVAPRALPAAHPREETRARETVKPRDDGGVVIKITDFGIAKILDAQGVTSTGQVLGSPAHMAPEQIEGGEVDARTDVFALGVLMYECLVGHLPFEGKNPAQVLRRVLEGSYPAADRERPAVGGRWSRLVAQALARDATERVASAAELGDAIRAELGALGITDAKAEIDAYFADPEGYTQQITERLVPRLVSRGEAARRSGDIPGAAADFNRALALRPDDLTILKRIGSLTSSAGRRLLVRRAAAIIAGSAVLGVVAFQAARAWKASAAHPPAPPASASTIEAHEVAHPIHDRPAPSLDHASLSPVPSGSASNEPASKRPRTPANPGFTLPSPPSSAAPGTRMVRFNINPKGAKLMVDGTQQSSFRPFSLPLGPHKVEVTPNAVNCCKKLSVVVQVDAPPASEPENVQQIPLTMEINPAKVMLSGAPQNGQLTCPELGLTCFAGSAQPVKLREAAQSTVCQFTAPDKSPHRARVSFNAGETNVIPWPAE
ncbi:serine/threonine protein kinase [Minicystis rosea]|nr:serine/threonine protein kinase [Minicystis rosea]